MAALYDLTFWVREERLAPSLPVYALLAMLFAHSDRRCPEGYREFWDCLVGVHDRGEHGDAYQRATFARTAWYGIVRSLGYEPMSIELTEAIDKERASLPKPPKVALGRDAQTLANGLKTEKWDREILAKKGHPYSEPARRLVAERKAAGKPIDGTG